MRTAYILFFSASKEKALYTSTPTGGNVKMIYFKLLHLNPIKVILSFTFVPDGILAHSYPSLKTMPRTYFDLFAELDF